jgi:deoxyribose-phosphate aldolase
MKSYVLPEPGSKVTSLQIAGIIDQSLIRPDMTVKEIKDGCSIAIEYGCASVSVKESEVPVAADMLKGSGVRIGSCLSFPHGCEPTSLKVLSAKKSADMGVEEIDMVMNIGRFKSGEYGYVEDDISAVAEVCHAKGMVL